MLKKQFAKLEILSIVNFKFAIDLFSKLILQRFLFYFKYNCISNFIYSKFIIKTIEIAIL